MKRFPVTTLTVVGAGVVSWFAFTFTHSAESVLVGLLAFAVGWLMESRRHDASLAPFVIAWAAVALAGYLIYESTDGAKGGAVAFAAGALTRSMEQKRAQEQQR